LYLQRSPEGVKLPVQGWDNERRESYKMKQWYWLMTVFLLFLGCYSVPQTRGGPEVAEGTYAVSIAKDYSQDPEKLKYAVNTWVKKQGHTSYDMEIRKSGDMASYYITMPGSIPVEDLPQVKHFHKKKTGAAIVSPVLGTLLLTILIVASL